MAQRPTAVGTKFTKITEHTKSNFVGLVSFVVLVRSSRQRVREFTAGVEDRS